MSSAAYCTPTPYTPHDARTVAPELIDRPLRILVPSYRSHPHTGGQGVYLRYLTRALADLGHEVSVISGPPYPVLDARVKLIELPSLDLYTKPKVFLGVPAMPESARRSWTDFYEYVSHVSGAFAEPTTFGMRLAAYLKTRAGEYDVVHDNQTLCRGLLSLRNFGLPVVGTIHHPITRDRRIAIEAADTLTLRLLVRRWYSFVFRQIKVARSLDNLVVPSLSTRRDVEEDFAIPAQRMELVYHGIDTDQFRPLPGFERKTNRLITTASADVPLKGLVYLIEAYHQLLADFPDLELRIIGKLREGHTDNMLTRLGIKERVSFVSNLTEEEIAQEYAKATIAVCPSVYEGFGFPAGEAMACGVAVVSTRGGSLPEVVGDAGILVPPKDPDALAREIAGLLREPARREALAAGSRPWILNTFQWHLTARQLTQIYGRVLTNHNWASNAHHRSQIAAA